MPFNNVRGRFGGVAVRRSLIVPSSSFTPGVLCVACGAAPVLCALIAPGLGLNPVLAAGAGAMLTGGVALTLLSRRRARGGELRQALEQLEPGTPPAPDESLADALARAARAARQRLAGAEELEATLRAVLDGVPSPVLATDTSGIVLVVNQAASEFFRERPGPLVGRNFEELFTQAEVLSLHAAAIQGSVGQGQVRLTGPDGARLYQVFACPTPGAGSVGAIMTMRDVTELATAVQLKTDFVANASHELRTPLSAIRGAVETLEVGAWDEPPMRERLTRMIANNVSRLEDMVRDLLDLSTLESPEAPVELSTSRLSDITSTLRDVFEGTAAERGLMLSFEIDPRLERLHTDPKLLLLVLRNLIDNAIKFAYEQTEVRVVGEYVPAPAAVRPGARFRVIDQGIGIPYGAQHRVFERFYQVDGSRTGHVQRRGTGLGLAIVKHAVRRLGGAISVESVWKQGTTMTVELPASVEFISAEPAA
ncbi:MAG: PAS domain-containing protein [Tepidisphaera sp.]|nr:PAS domain-containing protein [Tepidisphaera sp.]